VEGEWAGGVGVFEVGGFPEGAEGGEFFDEGAVSGPAGRDEFVVEVVALDQPVKSSGVVYRGDPSMRFG